MKNNNTTELRTCPLCGTQYSGYPALSRKYPTRRYAPIVAHVRR